MGRLRHEIKVLHDDLFSMLVGQVRYSVGRQSYIVGVACDQVRRYWRHLSPDERVVVEESVTGELARYERMGATCGMDTDHRQWVALAAWMAENRDA